MESGRRKWLQDGAKVDHDGAKMGQDGGKMERDGSRWSPDEAKTGQDGAKMGLTASPPSAGLCAIHRRDEGLGDKSRRQ